MELFSISKEIEHIPFFEYMICFKEHMAWRLNKPFKVDKPRSYPTLCDQITYKCTVALATLYHFLWNIVSFHNLFPLIAGLQLKSRRLLVDTEQKRFSSRWTELIFHANSGKWLVVVLFTSIAALVSSCHMVINQEFSKATVEILRQCISLRYVNNSLSSIRYLHYHGRHAKNGLTFNI